MLENRIKKAMDIWTGNQLMGQWLKSLCGVGPVISAGVIAHIDLDYRKPDGRIGLASASAVWAKAGLRPGQRRVAGKKVDFIPAFKRLCFIAGGCFVKFQNHKNDIYGKLYAARRQYEGAKNERKEYAEQAAQALADKRYRDDTVAKQWYEKGMLPPAHLYNRATRYAVKIFLAHAWQVAWEIQFNEPAPNVWVIEHGGHAPESAIPIPNWPFAGKAATGKR